MHSAIAISIAIGFFSLAMFVLYLAFVSPQTVQLLPDVIRRRLTMTCQTSDDLGDPTTVLPGSGTEPDARSAGPVDVQAAVRPPRVTIFQATSAHDPTD